MYIAKLSISLTKKKYSGSDFSFVDEKYLTAMISFHGSEQKRILSAGANIYEHAQPYLACVPQGNSSRKKFSQAGKFPRFCWMFLLL